ncbi:unnamed protein product [Bursaphelenchus okinawaensis]|uniref:C-type lectin domain-containing protein n=1 Tax=Bursaphelenchus okinawaensis TaxID=465554 RepID=A0A811KGL9_9BILA|nr:unnamed protein product [Bursaphelenchus okinawaensis]CAG9102554.1 unnamed protein product [Bursaphelenchus okinawaensis]
MYILLIISVLNLVVNVVTSCTCSGTNLSIDGEETCFQVVEDSGGSWSSADKKCSNLGGFLAHVTNKTLLTDLKSLVNSSSSRYMVGHVVGNVEYNMIAYMCPNNAYKSLMNDSTISQVATGNATTNSTCMFFETSDSKLHYGNCNQQSDVICQIPMETTDYCGIMCGGVTASSTVKATSNTTVPGAKTTVSGAKTIVSNSKTTVSDSKTTVSRTKDDCDCSGVTKEIDGINTCLEVQSGSGGSWKSADQKCYKSDGYLAHIRDDTMLETIQSYIKTSYKQPIMVGHVVGNAEYNLIAYMCPNNSYKSLVNNTLINETISGTSGTNETCLFIEDSDYKLHYGTCTQASDVLCEIPLENDSRCGVMKTCSSTAMPKTTLSSSQVGSFDSNNNNTKTNVKNSVNNNGTYDKEETIGPSNSGKYSNDSNNEYDKNDNNNMNNNMQKSQSNMLQHSSSNSSIEDLLNQSDYNFNDTDMSFNDTNNNRSDYDMIGKFGHNQHNGHDDNNHLECYGNGYNRVGKYCVRWWIWFIVGLLILAMAICICGVGCYFCGLNMCRRNRNNIVILEQPTQSIVVEKLRPTSTITTVVETIEVIGNRHGRPSILYDVAVAETIIPEEIIPPKPYYATSPMMMIGSGEFSDRSMSLGMGDNRLYSPSDRITHENLTGPKLTLPTNGPYDERLPTGATALIPPPVVQAESDNIPSMSDGIPVRTFDRAPGRSPTPSDEDFSDGIREFNRNGIGRQGGRF